MLPPFSKQLSRSIPGISNDLIGIQTMQFCTQICLRCQLYQAAAHHSHLESTSQTYLNHIQSYIFVSRTSLRMLTMAAVIVMMMPFVLRHWKLTVGPQQLPMVCHLTPLYHSHPHQPSQGQHQHYPDANHQLLVPTLHLWLSINVPPVSRKGKLSLIYLARFRTSVFLQGCLQGPTSPTRWLTVLQDIVAHSITYVP